MRHDLTIHAAMRLQQRGNHRDDVDRIFASGTDFRDGTLFLRKKDVNKRIAVLKAEIRAYERLKNTKLAISAGRIVTGHKATRKEQRRMKRCGQWDE